MEAECANYSATETHLISEKGKYIERRPYDVTTSQKIVNQLQKTRVSIVYLLLKFDEIQTDYLALTLIFLIRV